MNRVWPQEAESAMSYILEALRRSQAERERGQVPGLHDQPASLAQRPARPEAGRWQGPLAVAALALAVVGLALWVWPGHLRQAAQPPGAPGAPATTPATAVPAPALPQVVSAPVEPMAPAQPEALPMRAAPAAPPAPAAPRATKLTDLSAEQRRELPPLSLGGAVWSESALSRFVIVNGQVVREGETAAPGVVVERIGPKAVQLRWRQLLLEVPL